MRAQVVINNRVVSYLRWGDGTHHVVLLHGITSSARTWWRVAPVIANLGYTVTAFDMPGHGESNMIGAHDIPSIAQHIANALNSLGIEQPSIVGHSWGGATAIHLATLIPVSRVTLVDPAVQMNPDHGASVVERYAEGVGDAPHQTTGWLTARHKLWHRCDVVWKAEALAQCRREAVDGLFIHSGTWDLTSSITTIPAPTLCLVAATAATVIPAAAQLTIQHALQHNGGRYIQVDGTDHNMFRGGFDLTMPHLVNWLKKEH
jgi:pimeloyl-ACP methyl ester carboxylesterase